MMTAAGRYSFLGGASGSLSEYVRANPQHTSNLQARHILNTEKFTTDVADTCNILIDSAPAATVESCLKILEYRFKFFGVTELWSDQF